MVKKNRSAEIDSWIEKTLERKNTNVCKKPGIVVYDNYEDIRKHQQRKKFFALSGLAAIILTLISAIGYIFSIPMLVGLRPLLVTFAFVSMFICYRLYDRVKNLYQAAIYSGFIIILFETWCKSLWYILALKFPANIIGVAMLLVLFGGMIFCIYLADIFLNYIWNWIGEEK